MFIFSSAQSQFSDEMTNEELKLVTEPSSMHNHLHQLEGIWKQNVIIQSGKEPIYAKAKSENRMIYGGKYLEINTVSSILEQEFKSRKFIGFDTRINKFFLFMIDEMGVIPVYAVGDYDSVNKKFTFLGKQESMSKQIENTFRIEIKIERENKYVQNIFINNGKKDKKTMETMSIRESE